MATVQIKIRLGTKGKTVASTANLIRVGKNPDCEIPLPFPWLQDVHLLIENTAQLLRVKLGCRPARAEVGGNALGMDWTLLASPSRLVIPAPKGYSLVLDVSCVDSSLNVLILREASGRDAAVAEDIPVDVATQNRFGTQDGSADFRADDLGGIPLSGNGENMTRGQRATIVLSSMLAVLLVVGALAGNRVRDEITRRNRQADIDFVNEHMTLARDLMARKDYRGAREALTAADLMMARRPEFFAKRAELMELRRMPEIQLGANGYEEMDGRWLSPEQAKAWKLVRERDDPRIAELEQRATLALQTRKFDDGRLACEEALALIQAHPIRPHPRESALKAQLETLKTHALESDMLAKGFVRYETRWVTPDEKLRLEQQAKGLVEYQGAWMTRDEMADLEKKGGSGKVFYEGKWMTVEQKMAAQGYLQFEGHWVRSEERDATLAKRQDDKDKAAAAEKQVADERLAAATAEKLKSVAFAKSVDFLKAKFPAALTMKFEAFASSKTHVVFDDGWYIVRGESIPDHGAARVFYCKLHPKDGGTEWEAETTLLND